MKLVCLSFVLLIWIFLFLCGNYRDFNLNWLAPEVMREESYTEKMDTYSFGIILCELYLMQVSAFWSLIFVLPLRFHSPSLCTLLVCLSVSVCSLSPVSKLVKEGSESRLIRLPDTYMDHCFTFLASLYRVRRTLCRTATLCLQAGILKPESVGIGASEHSNICNLVISTAYP